MKGENKRRVNICYVQCVSKLYNTLSFGWKVYIAAETELEYSSHWAQKGWLYCVSLDCGKKCQLFCVKRLFFFCSILLNDLHALESKGKHAVDHLVLAFDVDLNNKIKSSKGFRKVGELSLLMIMIVQTIVYSGTRHHWDPTFFCYSEVSLTQGLPVYFQ